MSRLGKSIVIAGDVAVDWIGWDKKLAEHPISPHNWTLYSGLRMIAQQGGVLLLKRMMETAIEAENLDMKIISHHIENVESLDPNDIIHSNIIIKPFPLSSDPRTASPEVFRVQRYCGFAGPDNGRVPPLPIQNDDPDADVVLLDDAGNGFRDNEGVWPEVLKTDKRPLIILKMSRPLQEGKLWKLLHQKYPDNLVVIINANSLRECGVHISYRLSWERTAEDFLRQIKNNPKVRELRTCKHLIVRFGLDGAIYYSRNNGSVSASLFYDPSVAEDGFKELHPGEMQGLFNAFTAGYTVTLLKSGRGAHDEAIKKGIIASRNLLKFGLGNPPNKPEYQFKELFKSGGNEYHISKIDIPEPMSYRLKDKSSWTILETLNEAQIENISYDIVKKGKHSSFDRVPIWKYGELKAIDRNEIEGYQSIKNLIHEYDKTSAVKHPLCIAVFGPPGSGKSFGVSQLVKSVSKKEIHKIEFNLSQYERPEQLISAFHAVRDSVLVGNLPLVFFDEFDSKLNNEQLGWLKYFLAPMQDGEFKDGETMHPIGKAIFVFAGGTYPSFEKFCHYSMDDTAEEQDDEESSYKKFQNAKGTDFLSRLRGYIDILGCNKANDQDRFFMIRRALLLRSLLWKNARKIFDEHDTCRIDDCIVRAFLKVPEFRHGVRSMEAIIEMSMLSKKTAFGQSSLPSQEQLRLHVDDDMFMKLVLQDVLFGDELERLAKSIHEQYRVTMKGQDPAKYPAMKPWDQLDDRSKESNRNAANHIPLKLDAINCGFKPIDKRKKGKKDALAIISSSDDLSIDEIETLARLEHERWVFEKISTGWKYGKKRDDSKKIHPNLIEWDKLTDSDKKKDYDAVKSIPANMAGAGFEIYRLQ